MPRPTLSDTSNRLPYILAILAVLLSSANCSPRPGAANQPASDHEAGQTESSETAASPDSRQPATTEKSEPPSNLVAHPFPRRMPAPGLTADAKNWLNTAGPLDLEQLRGKFVILDFWTYCCINCLHILPELKKLEHAYPNELVVIGVHSPKFETERELQNVREAILRYEVEHPVVNDPDMTIWKRYFVNSWPSLRVIDPEGQLVAGHSGEITFEVLKSLLDEALPYYRGRGKLDLAPLQFNFEIAQAEKMPLWFPGKVLADPSTERLWISDTGHNRIVVTDLAGKLQTVIGTGIAGMRDGSYDECQFNHPHGVAIVGDTVYVADTKNHAIRKIDLRQRQVETIAGTGVQNRSGWLPEDEQATPGEFRWAGRADQTALSSPWALWHHEGALYVAMAGPHQIWKLSLANGKIGLYAGNGRENIADGPLLPVVPFHPVGSSFAQPSGLASDGTWLYVADCEGSAIRAVPFDRSQPVRTVVGVTGTLFDFGDVDGPVDKARLQHALGVVYHRDALWVADTYNSKIKKIDPHSGHTTTIAGVQAGESDRSKAIFDEPGGISAAHSKLYVADTNHHAIRVIDLDDDNRVTTLAIAGLAPPAASQPSNPWAGCREIVRDQPAVLPANGQATIRVQIRLPDGWKLNPLANPQYARQASGAQPGDPLAVPQQVDPASTEFEVTVPIAADQRQLVLGIKYFYCREGAEGMCKLDRVLCKIPIQTTGDATAEPLELEIQAP